MLFDTLRTYCTGNPTLCGTSLLNGIIKERGASLIPLSYTIALCSDIRVAGCLSYAIVVCELSINKRIACRLAFSYNVPKF